MTQNQEAVDQSNADQLIATLPEKAIMVIDSKTYAVMEGLSPELETGPISNMWSEAARLLNLLLEKFGLYRGCRHCYYEHSGVCETMQYNLSTSPQLTSFNQPKL